MKKRTFIFIGCLMAVLCSGLLLCLENIQESVLNYSLYFPICLIADGLRNLSISSKLGNIIAIVLYIFISASPFFVWLYLFKNKKHTKEDIFLLFLSIVLFVGIYLAVNPFHLSIPIFVGSIIYSILICYGVLKIISAMKTASDQIILKYLSIGLQMILISLLFIAFYKLSVEYQFRLIQLQQKNYNFLGQYNHLYVTYITLFIEQIVDSLPNFAGSILVYHILNFIHFYQKDSYSEESLNRIIKIRDFSIQSLTIIVLSSLGNSLLQFLLIRYLYSSSIEIEIPILPIVIILGITLMSKMFADTISLKRDNEMFI